MITLKLSEKQLDDLYKGMSSNANPRVRKKCLIVTSEQRGIHVTKSRTSSGANEPMTHEAIRVTNDSHISQWVFGEFLDKIAVRCRQG